MEGEVVPLEKLQVYKMSTDLSKLAWEVYEPMDWHLKKILGDQFIRSVDSISANIAEAFGRFHYLDKIKFLYISRGSLFEAKNWTDRLFERKKITPEQCKKFKEISEPLGIKLNNLIAVTTKAKHSTQ